MKIHKLVEGPEHSWYVLGRDDNKTDSVIDTNEYLIRCNEESILLDPGGTEIFPDVVSAVSRILPVEQIKHFLCSHQDPDIFSSLPLWMGLCPQAKIYLSWVWAGFVAHYGHEYVSQFVKIADQGQRITVGKKEFHLVPAHYLHSSGNFHLYDPELKVLFSGDIGAALLPPSEDSLFVKDFHAHTQHMEAFHKRWMPSERARDHWLARVRELDIKYMCPQHGSIFQGDQVGKFFDWFGGLELGSALV
ncbi:MAG: MBL fold metallo-hydrolase [Fibrobacterota bacterium]